MFSCYSAFQCEQKHKLELVVCCKKVRCSWFCYNLLSFCSTHNLVQVLKACPQRQQGLCSELITKHPESLLGNEGLLFCVGTMQLLLWSLPLVFPLPCLPLVYRLLKASACFWRSVIKACCGKAPFFCQCRGKSWGPVDGLNCSWCKPEVFPWPYVLYA